MWEALTWIGKDLLSTLSNYSVITDAVTSLEGTSGLAFITVSADGENQIILSSGANGKVMPSNLNQVWSIIEGCSAVLLQNEIPWETSFKAMEMAFASGIRVYFNPAPAFKLPEQSFPLIHCLILNETEAEVITGSDITDSKGQDLAVKALIGAGLESVVLTLGGRGALYADREGGMIRVEAFHVNPLDTTAAGDTFIGAFAVVREQRLPIEYCLRFASAAAAIAVTRAGAQQSIPTREKTLAFLEERS